MVLECYFYLRLLVIIMTFVFQALPIFLDALVTAWGAILISVTLILLFGEVRFDFFTSLCI